MRITLDIDKKKDGVVRGKAVLLKTAFPDCVVRYRRSSSGKGGHIEVMNSSISVEEAYNIRYILGDHDKRIHIDASRSVEGNLKLPQQVLFDFKIIDGKIKRAGDWIYVSSV